jgi:hypothetical protein
MTITLNLVFHLKLIISPVTSFFTIIAHCFMSSKFKGLDLFVLLPSKGIGVLHLYRRTFTT